MPKRGEYKPKAPLGDPNDPGCLGAYARRYLKWMRVRQLSPRTVENHEVYLRYFIEWAEAMGVTQPLEVSRSTLEEYQEYLYDYRQKNGDTLAPTSQHRRLVAPRQFFRWMTRKEHIPANPAADLDLPKQGRPLPRNVMNAEEAQRVFEQPDLRKKTGIRDRAILEVLYATGIRRFELCNLTLNSIDAERGVLTVRKGKGNKDRVVPILPRAIAWVERYVSDIRPDPMPEFEDVLFLTIQGRSITPNRLTMIVREYIRAADTGKGGSCHAFRHSLATGMLDNGADIRHVQEQLGHADISTTQIYTHVSVAKLQEVYVKTHPLNQGEDDGGDEERVGLVVEARQQPRH